MSKITSFYEPDSYTVPTRYRFIITLDTGQEYTVSNSCHMDTATGNYQEMPFEKVYTTPEMIRRYFYICHGFHSMMKYYSYVISDNGTVLVVKHIAAVRFEEIEE